MSQRQEKISEAASQTGGQDSLRPIRRLVVVVHPFFLRPIEEEAASDAALLAGLLAGAVPQREDDVTVFMPMPGNEQYGRVDAVRLAHDLPSWQLAVEQISDASRYPQNVFVVNDIVVGEDRQQRGAALLRELRGAGYDVSPSTAITMAGEWRDGCVAIAARRIMDSWPIGRILISKEMSRAASQVYNGHPRFVEQGVFPREGFAFDESTSHYIIERQPGN